MQQKRFTKNDQGFICENCATKVNALGYTSRDHCPNCLCSKHVDIYPGDRANNCMGLLIPLQAIPDAKKGYVIIYRCRSCNAKVKNKAALEGDQSDNTSLLIRLTNAQENNKIDFLHNSK